jgi:dTDP-glucose 4,6-dehydratase
MISSSDYVGDFLGGYVMNLENKKVLVTGAGGFIGSHLTERLVEIGSKVKAFVRYNSNNNWGWIEKSKYKDEIEVYVGDIRDYDSVRDAMKGVDVVFHLAALIGIPYSYISPLAYIKTNIEGTYNVLQVARDLETSRILTTSTSEVYGTAKYVPIDENHPFQGQSPYSATKIGADRLVESFYRSFNMPVTIVRPFNTYGPRQSARAVIPTIITQLLAGREEIKLGALTPTRDFNYVKDTINGFIEIAKSDKTIGEEINIATQKEISIGQLAKELIRQINPNAKIVCDETRLRPENSEVNRLLGSNEKIKKLTNWKSQYTLEQGLTETIEFIRQNLDRYKVDIYNI